VPQGDQMPAVPSANPDVAPAVIKAVSDSLVRRGYLTTEWWTTMIGGAVSAILAVVHINASSATHVVAVVAPALLAALYAITRSMHKSAVASALGGVFPQAVGASAAPSAAGQGASSPGIQPGQGQTVDQVAAAPPPAAAPAPAPAPAATVQTDPDFVFEGIPPIEDVNG
jgi:hypothetical protein